MARQVCFPFHNFDFAPAKIVWQVQINPTPECGRPRPQQWTDGEVLPGFPTSAWSATLLRPGTGALRQIVAFWSWPWQMAVQTPKNAILTIF
jgi:hypothetical protein